MPSDMSASTASLSSQYHSITLADVCLWWMLSNHADPRFHYIENSHDGLAIAPTDILGNRADVQTLIRFIFADQLHDAFLHRVEVGIVVGTGGIASSDQTGGIVCLLSLSVS